MSVLRPGAGLVLLATLALVTAGCGSGQGLRGTRLEPPIAAAAFTLKDQHNHTRAASEFQGKVVVLAFMYTQCPDVCPLLADKLQQAHAALVGETRSVAFAVISVDPENDTPQAALEFSQRHGLEDGWAYLTGSREALEPVWRHYFVDVQHEGDARSLVEHSSPVYLLDKSGQARVLVQSSDLDVALLLQDIRSLLR